MIGIFLQVLAGVIAFAVALFVWIAVGGPLSTAVRQYALLFYGGRYGGQGMSPSG
jgi:carbon starvation protein CstA